VNEATILENCHEYDKYGPTFVPADMDYSGSFGSSTTTTRAESSTSETYLVNGKEVSQAEFEAMQANGGTTTTSSSSTYMVNGKEIS